MDETTFRIIDALSRDFGRPTSINGLVGRIREMRRGAYYKNIYDKIQKLQKEGLIRAARIGRNSEITLNFGSYVTKDMLAEMELRKKHQAMKENKSLQNILSDIEEQLRQFGTISCACIISPGKTLPLNRLELLVIFRETPRTEGMVQKEMLHIYGEIRKLQDKRNAKIDILALRESEFSSLLKADEYNPLREMVSGEIAFFYPQNFWFLVGQSAKTGIGAERLKEVNVAKIPEKDLVYNMERFGYKEIGTIPEEGNKMCLECTMTSILLSGNARRIEAIPVILAKNTPNYNLLIFLSRKYNAEGKLLGMIRVMNGIKRSKESEIGDRRRQETPSIEYAIKALEALKTKEEKANEMSIKKKMRLYHAD
ncbi:MAG: hypothetical protein NTY20_01205 [Candidatus Aenigmarchaeota archaeon]|nr:hypothetical protein [Candidatus Aenigmarchaeota archaeon]